MKVVPVINCDHLDCVVSKLDILSRFLGEGDSVHLDVADARFTFNRTWGDWKIWKELLDHVNLGSILTETHLMVEEPEQEAKHWLEIGVKKIIVHIETIKDISEILSICRQHEAELMLALNPETPIDDLKQYLEYCQSYMVLAVNPGMAGQRFLPRVLDKVRFLKKEKPHAKIEIDGGIDEEVAMLAYNAGADVVTSSSYIFSSQNPEAAYKNLTSL